jgi:hypothetical protein
MFIALYYRNPKLSLTIEDHPCEVTVALLQKNRRALRMDEGQNNLNIGFDIYKVI